MRTGYSRRVREARSGAEWASCCKCRIFGGPPAAKSVLITRMTKKPLIVVVLGACTAQPTQTSLAELRTSYGDTHLEVVARSQLNIVLHVDSAPGECPMLLDDVTA